MAPASGSQKSLQGLFSVLQSATKQSLTIRYCFVANGFSSRRFLSRENHDTVAETSGDPEWETPVRLRMDAVWFMGVWERSRRALQSSFPHDNAGSVRLHLLADISCREKLVRFIENHEEPGAAAIFHPLKHRAAAVAVCTLPGALLVFFQLSIAPMQRISNKHYKEHRNGNW